MYLIHFFPVGLERLWFIFKSCYVMPSSFVFGVVFSCHLGFFVYCNVTFSLWLLTVCFMVERTLPTLWLKIRNYPCCLLVLWFSFFLYFDPILKILKVFLLLYDYSLVPMPFWITIFSKDLYISSLLSLLSDPGLGVLFFWIYFRTSSLIAHAPCVSISHQCRFCFSEYCYQ